MTPITTLGGGIPRAALGEWPSVAYAESGNLVVSGESGAELILFSPDGKKLKAVGRAGDGPGEYRNIGMMFFGPGDTLYVQSGIGTITVLDGALNLVRRLTAIGDCQLPLANGGLLCVGPHATPGTPGLVPFTKVSAEGEPGVGFGSAGPDQPCGRCASYLSPVAESRASEFWVIEANDYRVERWSVGGDRLDAFRVQTSWLPGEWREIKGAPGGGVSTGRVWGIHDAGDGRLWVYGSRPVDAPPSGESRSSRGVPRMDVAQEGHGTVIELLDPSQGVLVHKFFPERRIMPLQGGMAFSTRYDADGYVLVDIWKVTVDSSATQLPR